MPISSSGGHLADKRYVTICLRLLIDAKGQLVYGEAVEVHHGPLGRFRSWTELSEMVQAWLLSDDNTTSGSVDGGK